MVPRKDNLAPYEVMRQATQRGKAPEPAPAAAADQPAPADGESPRGRWGWLTGPRQPLLLRVPKGYIVLAGAVLVGVIVLAHWSGRSVGHREGFRTAVEQFEATQPGGLLWDVEENTGSGTGQAAARPGARVIEIPTAEQDPRQDGLNYWVLAHYRQAEAERFLAFLWSRQVEAAAFRRHNSGLFQVVALKGFAPGELRDAAEKYRQQLLALGRVWRDQHRGSDLSRNGIYLEKYTGGTSAAMIVRADAVRADVGGN